MNVLMRFIMTLLANLAWQRVGGRGAVPPVRLPRSKQPLNIPVLTPWQMMAAMWVARKFWGQFGNQVKSKIDAVNHPAARQVGAWLPDPDLQNGVSNMPKAPSASAPVPRTWTTTAQPAPTSAAPQNAGNSATASTPKARPQAPSPRDYGTRKLDDDATSDTPSKSVFSNWRRPAKG